MALDKASLRELDGVHPDLRAVVLRAADLMAPGSFSVEDGLRTRAEQARHVANGASKTMNSRHLTGHGVDLLAWRDGKDAWKFPANEHVSIFRPVAAAMKQAASQLGVTVEWGQEVWGWDAPHFQLPRSIYGDDDMSSHATGVPATFNPTRFNQVVALLIQTEGGFSDHPADNGGPTKYGITKATLEIWRGRPVTGIEVGNLDRAEAETIYRVLYWQVIRGDELPAGVDYAVMDFAVHSGAPKAAWYLQGVVGTRQDYIIGPVTLAAVKQIAAGDLVRRLMDTRHDYLSRHEDWNSFKVGWTSRINAVRETALAMTQATVRRDNIIGLEDIAWWQFAALAVLKFFTRTTNPNPNSKGTGPMFTNTIARILLRALGFLDGKKTATGIVGLVMGGVIYAAQALGYTPVEPTDTLKQVIDYAVALFTNGGAALALYGIGDRSGKIKGGISG